jgi:hypothetical protein
MTAKAVHCSDIMTFIGRLPDKSSAADPIPTSLLKDIADLVSPYISELFSRSLAAGYYPLDFKHAFITPTVKKAGMDASDAGSYRPIANLSVLSKLFERVVAAQIWDHLQRFDLLPPTQSGFRPGFSTETAILRVISDILAAVDRGDFAALVLLDLSTAFNTVDHAVLLERLRRSFGFSGVALDWLSSYLSGRTECVQRGSCRSSTTTLVCGVPQGSVLGPVLFILYTADLPSLVVRHGLQPHLYADDTQVYGSCRAGEVGAFISRLTECVDDVALWMRSNRLQMNAGKTEYMWFTTPRRIQQLPAGAISIGGHDILPVASARNLGVYFDSDLSMRRHIDVITARCYATLRQLRAVRRYVSSPVMQSLVTSLVLSRLITLTVSSSVFRRPASDGSRRSRMQLPVWSSTFVAPTTSPTRLFVYTGCVLLSVSVSRWRSWPFVPSTAYRHLTYMGSFRIRLDVLGCARHHRSV